MQTTGAGIGPATRGGHRVVGKNRGIVHAALSEAYAATILNIDGGDQKHEELLAGRRKNQLQ